MLRCTHMILRQCRSTAAAITQLQQQRFLNVHEYQVRSAQAGDDTAAAAAAAALSSALPRRWLAAAGHRLLLQGAQLMAKAGINVPDGMPAFSLDDVARAAEAMKDENGEVRTRRGACCCWRRRQGLLLLAQQRGQTQNTHVQFVPCRKHALRGCTA